MLIGYARVSKADGSQLLDSRLDALIGTGISGRKAASGGCGTSGSPDEAEIRPVQAVRGWVHPEPLGSPRKLLYGASGKANFGDSGFLTQISASCSSPTRCRRSLPLQCLTGAEGSTCFLQESGFEWLFTAAARHWA